MGTPLKDCDLQRVTSRLPYVCSMRETKHRSGEPYLFFVDEITEIFGSSKSFIIYNFLLFFLYYAPYTRFTGSRIRKTAGNGYKTVYSSRKRAEYGMQKPCFITDSFVSFNAIMGWPCKGKSINQEFEEFLSFSARIHVISASRFIDEVNSHVFDSFTKVAHETVASLMNYVCFHDAVRIVSHFNQVIINVYMEEVQWTTICLEQYIFSDNKPVCT